MRPRGSRYSLWLPERPVRRASKKRFASPVVGLLGGSFNPAHEGHLAISLEALKRLGLDQVWWLVAPQNPLKPEHETAPYETRIEVARDVARHPRIVVSDLEQHWACHYTVETLDVLETRYAERSFIWLMGADAFAGLHNWKDWRDIVSRIPIAVFNRPGSVQFACHSKAAQTFPHARRHGFAAGRTGPGHPPAWCILDIPLQPQSSSAIRSVK